MNLLTLIHNLNERLIKTVQNNINKHVDNIGNDVVNAMSKLPFTDSNIEAIFNYYGISTIDDALNITEWSQLRDIFDALKKYNQPFDLKVFQYFTNLKNTSSLTDIWHSKVLSLGGAPVTEIIFPKNLENIAPGFCIGCSQLKKVIFLGNKIETIGSEAFAGCSSLTSIELPTSIKSIEYKAFSQTNISGTLNLHGATDIGINAFSMTNIDNIVWDSLTKPCTIECGTRAFADTSLKNVTIPEGVEAFNNISAFNKISQLNLPSTFKPWKDDIFNAPFNDDFIINIADNNPYMKAINNAVVSKDGTTLYKLFSYAQIPDGVTYIAPYAIEIAKFNELIIPETCTKIDSYGINNINCKVLSLNSKLSLGCESLYQIKTDNLLLGKNVKTYSLRNSKSIRNLNALNIYTANKKIYDKLITAMPNNVFMLDDYSKDTNEISDIDISIDAFKTKINTLLSTYGKQDLDKNGNPTKYLKMLNWHVYPESAWICIGVTLESQNLFIIDIDDEYFRLGIENYKCSGFSRTIRENFKVFDLFMANNKASKADSDTNITEYKYTENNINIIEKLLKEMVKPSNDNGITILNSEFINNGIYTPGATFKYIAKRFSCL